MIVNYVATEKLAVSTGAAATSSYSNDKQEMLLAVISSSAFHALVSPLVNDAPVDATTNNAYFPANTIHFFPVPVNARLSVRGTASTDAWVSKVTVVND